MREGGPMTMKRSLLAGDSNRTYREMLLEKRTEVLSGLGIKFDTLAQMGRVAEEDQAQISNDESVSLHLNTLDYAQLRLIEEAIDRLDSGDYGICLSCEEPIPPKRLRAVSWARYCVRCQEAIGAGAERDWNEARSRVPVGARQ
jgi:DnaK suppressor protein